MLSLQVYVDRTRLNPDCKYERIRSQAILCNLFIPSEYTEKIIPAKLSYNLIWYRASNDPYQCFLVFCSCPYHPNFSTCFLVSTHHSFTITLTHKTTLCGKHNLSLYSIVMILKGSMMEPVLLVLLTFLILLLQFLNQILHFLNGSERIKLYSPSFSLIFPKNVFTYVVGLKEFFPGVASTG
jgi:hypothetical protein